MLARSLLDQAISCCKVVQAAFTEKPLKFITTTLVFLVLGIDANVCVAGISGQRKLAKKTSSWISNSYSNEQKERARRVIDERIENNASEIPLQRSLEKPDGESLTSAADPQENKALPDSLTQLRNQIEAAENGPERIRLQLRLSEQLVAVGQK